MWKMDDKTPFGETAGDAARHNPKVIGADYEGTSKSRVHRLGRSETSAHDPVAKDIVADETDVR